MMATGKGVVVAVVDTGVDFSNPDMMDAVARDENNHPVMLGPRRAGHRNKQTQRFVANIDKNGVMRNTDTVGEHTSKVYVDETGVYLDIEQGGTGTIISVYNSLYPVAGLISHT